MAMVLVVGTPADEFRIIGPVTPNDPDLDAYSPDSGAGGFRPKMAPRLPGMAERSSTIPANG